MDDTIIFVKASTKEIKVIKYLLSAFRLASGLQINFSKSLLVLINFSYEFASHLARTLRCKMSLVPIRYFGLPLVAHLPKRQDFLLLIDKFDSKLAGWKGSSLSFDG